MQFAEAPNSNCNCHVEAPHVKLPLKLTQIEPGTSLISVLSSGNSWSDPEPGTVPGQSGTAEGGRCHSTIGQPAAEGSPGHTETRVFCTADIPGLSVYLSIISIQVSFTKMSPESKKKKNFKLQGFPAVRNKQTKTQHI